MGVALAGFNASESNANTSARTIPRFLKRFRVKVLMRLTLQGFRPESWLLTNA
jgi:hypothetical protein